MPLQRRDEIRISQPGALEDISHYIYDMYEQAGGNELFKRIMEEKRDRRFTGRTAL